MIVTALKTQTIGNLQDKVAALNYQNHGVELFPAAFGALTRVWRLHAFPIAVFPNEIFPMAFSLFVSPLQRLFLLFFARVMPINSHAFR